jgi:hypothetical protein
VLYSYYFDGVEKASTIEAIDITVIIRVESKDI